MIRPWSVSGGESCFDFDLPWAVGDPAVAGVQLCTSVYIPEGSTGFVKGIKIAPFKPSVLDNQTAFWVNKESGNNASETPGPNADNGWWQTPFGWECFENTEIDERPFWQWHLRFIPGDIERFKLGNIPPFSVADPDSWYLVPNIAVPREGYVAGIPGSSPGDPWPSQRMQRVGNWEESQVHVVIPGDSTVCLFAEWRQPTIQVLWQVLDVGAEPPGFDNVAGPTVFVLQPSFGQLIGYTQPANRPDAQRSARSGWES